MANRKAKRNYRRTVLRLPDLDHSKLAVLNSLASPGSRRVYQFGDSSKMRQRGVMRAKRSFPPLGYGSNWSADESRNAVSVWPLGDLTASPMVTGDYTSVPARDSLQQLEQPHGTRPVGSKVKWQTHGAGGPGFGHRNQTSRAAFLLRYSEGCSSYRQRRFHQLLKLAGPGQCSWCNGDFAPMTYSRSSRSAECGRHVTLLPFLTDALRLVSEKNHRGCICRSQRRFVSERRSVRSPLGRCGCKQVGDLPVGQREIAKVARVN